MLTASAPAVCEGFAKPLENRVYGHVTCLFLHQHPHEFELWVQVLLSPCGGNIKENMKGQEGHVLSAKAEFIAPSFILSHRFFGCLSLLEVRTLPPFLVGFVLGFGGCLVLLGLLLGSYLSLLLA